MKTAYVVTDFPELKFDGRHDKWMAQWERNLEMLQSQDHEARDAGKLVGRYIEEGIADGHATYIIIRENKKTVRIRHATGLGDDYMIPYWGCEASIEKWYAESLLEWRDSREEWVAKREKELATQSL